MFVLRRYAPHPTPVEQLYGDTATEWPAVYSDRARAEATAATLNARAEAGGGWVVETE